MPSMNVSMHAILAQETERTRGSSPIQMKELIAESDSKIASIQNEIAALESQIAALVERRDRECVVGNALRYLAAPIRKLPVEMLAEIFVLTLTEFKHILDAFRVSHVCCHWRQVAICTPRLWAGHIEVDIYPLFSQTKESYVSGLRAWLARSEPLSIPISITAANFITAHWGGIASSSTDIGSRLTEELLRVAPRWRSLRLADHSKSGSFIQRLAGGGLDSLEELWLSRSNHESSHLDPTTLSAFTAAPRLRKLAYNTTCGIPMPWAQLTDITLENTIPPETFLDIFSQCVNVIRVTLCATGWSVVPPVRANVLALDQLQYLSIVWDDNVHGMLFLDCISAPALDELHLHFERDNRIVWAEATFTAFQLRSPNITKLKIDGDGFRVPSNTLITVLRHAQFLTHLTVDDCRGAFDKTLLEALSYKDDMVPLVPCLHSLSLAKSGSSLYRNDLVRMISSRWWTDADLASGSRVPAVARWSKIRLRDHSSRQVENPMFQDTMKELRETGLDARFVDLKSWSLEW